jgi:hypothetical protein
VTVGNANDAASNSFTLAEVWDGTAWTVQSTPNSTSQPGYYLDAVSCTSASHCAAVGDDFNSPNPVAMGWDGTAWTLRSTPAASGASSNPLRGVSCTSAACTAVGDSFTLVDATLVESGD